MRHVHHAKPFVAHRLERRDAFAHAVHENLAAAAGNGAQPGLHEIADDLLHRLVEKFLERDELARAEPVDVHLRKLRLHVREQVEIPLLRQLRMMPALHENLRATERDRLLDLPIHLVVRDHIRVGFLLRAIERAELAIDVADVRVVDVAIHDVGDDLVAAPLVSLRLLQLPAMIRQRAKLLQRQPVQAQRLNLVNALAIPDLLQELIQRRVVNHKQSLESRDGNARHGGSESGKHSFTQSRMGDAKASAYRVGNEPEESGIGVGTRD